MGEFDRLFARHRHDAVLLHRPYPPHAAPRANSQLGGLPRLPAHHDWPRTSTGVPLHFLAQIDCADLPFASALPDRGILFFFGRDDYDQVWNHRGQPSDDCRVLYLLDASATTPLRHPPAGLPPIRDDYHRSGSRDFLRAGEVGPTVHPGWPVQLLRVDSWPNDRPMSAVQALLDGIRDRLGTRTETTRLAWGDFTIAVDQRDVRYGDELTRRRMTAFTAASGERSLQKDHEEDRDQSGTAAAQVFDQAEDGPDAYPSHWLMIHYAARALLHRPESFTPSRHPRFRMRVVAEAERWLARAGAAGLESPVGTDDQAEFRACLRKLRQPRHDPVLSHFARKLIFLSLVATVQDWAGDRTRAARIPPVVYDAVRFHLNGFAYGDLAFAQMLGHAPSAQDARSPNDPTVCLLNLASDYGMGWMFGDVGNASFWITPEALAARDFGKVWATIEGH